MAGRKRRRRGDAEAIARYDRQRARGVKRTCALGDFDCAVEIGYDDRCHKKGRRGGGRGEYMGLETPFGDG